MNKLVHILTILFITLVIISGCIATHKPKTYSDGLTDGYKLVHDYYLATPTITPTPDYYKGMSDGEEKAIKEHLTDTITADQNEIRRLTHQQQIDNLKQQQH